MNTFIKTSLHLFLITSLVVFVPQNICASMPTQMPQQMPGIPGLPQLSEAEMKQFEAELAELNSKLEGKSPEEQEAILNEMVQEAMEEVRKDLSDEGKAILDKLEQGDITEEDFDKLLNELMPTEEKEAPAPVEVKPAPKAEPKIIITSKHQEVLDRINSLINHTNLFIQKAGTIAELPGKINQWEKEKKINWQPKLTWNTFRSDLDIFVSKLNKLKEQDPKTQEYKHLDELLKTEALYNNLSKVEKIAAEFEPKIEEIAPIGGLPIPESSKAALQKLLSQYNEALYILKLSAAIDTLFEKFEPKAKSSREAEEKAQKIAEQENKKPRTPGRSVVGGSSPRESYQVPYEDTYDYNQFGYNSNQPNQVFIPTYEPQDTFLPSSRSPRGSSRTSSSSFTSPAGSKEERTAKGENSSESSVASREALEKDKTPAIPHHVIKAMEKEKSSVEAVINPLKDIASLVKDHKVLSELEAEVKKSGSYNKKLVDQILPDLDSALRKTKREFDSFTATAKADQKKYLATQIKDKGKKALEALNTLTTQIDSIEKIKGTLSLENQYVYFGHADINEYMAEIIEKTLPLPADHNRFIKLWEDAGFSNLPAVTQQFIIEKNPNSTVQQALNDMVSTVENLNKIESELPRPVTLTHINKLAKEVRQAIG